MAKICFGIDVGGTTVKCGMFTTDGTLLDKWEITTRTENGGENVLPDIAATVISKLRLKGYKDEDCAGIGVGIPGPVMRGVVPVAVNLHWGEKNVEYELSQLTGMKVRAANDANVAALGEAWKGGGEGKKEIIVVTLGTGVGGGIIIDGAIVEGLHGAGGEIGHMHVDDNITALCNCGHSGCLEQVASATGIARLAREELALHPEYTGDLRTGEVTAKAVFDAYKEDDPLATRVVNRFAKYLGTALANIAVVIDPEVIVIGGGVSRAGECLTDIVGNYYRSIAFSACANTPIVLARLGNDAGIYGAAKLVLGKL
ncbi:MAG: ROK family glucokinase [Lachnospiraceae bacterium]|nr:ROK family glucokinase [Lachnospiraceae bacterium]